MNPTLRKGLPLLIFLCFAVSVAFSQKIEIKANAYSGLSYFRGSASKSSSAGYYDNYGAYGRTPGFSYSFELQTQRVTRQKHLYGLGLAFERLSSKCDHTLLPPTDLIGEGPIPPADKGTTTFTNAFINLNPYAGQRLLNKTITLDATIGVDVAFNIKSKSTFTTSTYKEDLNAPGIISAPSVDARPRLQLSAGYRHINVLAAYSLGITNYNKWLKPKAYLHFLQFGIGYRIK